MWWNFYYTFYEEFAGGWIIEMMRTLSWNVNEKEYRQRRFFRSPADKIGDVVDCVFS